MITIRGNQNSETKWHRLDNTAVIFPILANRSFSSVYRIAVRLKDDVNPELLQQALDDTILLFDSFRIRLHKGFFWYYFETNKRRPLICEEKTDPCGYIDPTLNNQFLFKVSYFRNRISLEVFHAITDGTGAINFLKELTCHYFRLLDEEKPDDNREVFSVDVTSNFEDGYEKNYRKGKKTGFSTSRAYQIKGEKLPLFSMGVLHGQLDTKSVLDFCRSKNISINQYITTVLIWSIYKEHLHEQPSRNPIMVFIPVNLRPFFDSTTTLNFFSSISVGILIEKSGYTFEEMLDAVVNQTKAQLKKELFEQKIANNVAIGKNIFVRILPLALKNLAMRIAYFMTYDANTITVSNLGRIEMPEKYRDRIERFEILISVADREPQKCAVCSYEDKLIITFTSRLKKPYLQRAFFRKLAADGLDVVIESNGVYYEDL